MRHVSKLEACSACIVAITSVVIVIGLQPAALWGPRAVRMGLICFQSGRHVRRLYQALLFCLTRVTAVSYTHLTLPTNREV